ncbi:unnamed protein product [Effrenium voratum]|nr:unnamed protein product [Effrenium voratum]
MPSDSLERPRKVRRQEKPPQAKGSMPRQDARSTSARAQSQSQARDSSVAPKRKALKLSSRPATGPVTRSAASQKAQQLRVACKGTNVRAIQLALQDCEQTCRLGLLKEEKCAAERRIQMLQAEQAKARAAAQGGLVAIMEQQRAESFNEIPLLS